MSNETKDGCLPGLIRFCWMVIGNVFLIIAAAYIAKKSAPPHVAEAVLVLTVATLIAARWIDIRAFEGETIYAARATMADWRRYSAGVVIASAGLWALAAWAAANDWV